MLILQERAINQVKGLHEVPKETKQQQFLRPARQGKPQKSAKGSKTGRKKEALSKWKKQLLEACENEDEVKAVASIR